MRSPQLSSVHFNPYISIVWLSINRFNRLLLYCIHIQSTHASKAKRRREMKKHIACDMRIDDTGICKMPVINIYECLFELFIGIKQMSYMLLRRPNRSRYEYAGNSREK